MQNRCVIYKQESKSVNRPSHHSQHLGLGLPLLRKDSDLQLLICIQKQKIENTKKLIKQQQHKVKDILYVYTKTPFPIHINRTCYVIQVVFENLSTN